MYIYDRTRLVLAYFKTDADLQKFRYYIVSLEEVSRFIEFKGHGDEVMSIGSMIDKIIDLKHASARQTPLYDY